jgi:hypothetical protein
VVTAAITAVSGHGGGHGGSGSSVHSDDDGGAEKSGSPSGSSAGPGPSESTIGPSESSARARGGPLSSSSSPGCGPRPPLPGHGGHAASLPLSLFRVGDQRQQTRPSPTNGWYGAQGRAREGRIAGWVYVR